MDTNNKNHQHTAKCWRCQEIMNTRVKRNFLLRTLLFWLPVKVFFCAKCVSKRYVIQRDVNYPEVSTS